MLGYVAVYDRSMDELIGVAIANDDELDQIKARFEDALADSGCRGSRLEFSQGFADNVNEMVELIEGLDPEDD